MSLVGALNDAFNFLELHPLAVIAGIFTVIVLFAVLLEDDDGRL